MVVWVIYMSRMDFKLQWFFTEYKDKPIGNREEFRNNFRKKYGDFQYLNELIKSIEDYQIEKYGSSVSRSNFVAFRTSKEAIELTHRNRQRERKRLGK